MTVTRNIGADLLPFSQPSYPGARSRALRDVRARREREAPRPFNADRLRAFRQGLKDTGFVHLPS